AFTRGSNHFTGADIHHCRQGFGATEVDTKSICFLFCHTTLTSWARVIGPLQTVNSILVQHPDQGCAVRPLTGERRRLRQSSQRYRYKTQWADSSGEYAGVAILVPGARAGWHWPRHRQPEPPV